MRARAAPLDRPPVRARRQGRVRHRVMPLLVREAERPRALEAHPGARSVRTTALAGPVMPRGEDEVAFRMSTDDTPADIAAALAAREVSGGR